MFANTKAFSGFAVDDVQEAQEFYGETLGLKTSQEHGMLTLHLAGDRATLVYPKPDHTPATYTILNFPVDDIDEAVDELAARGVRFERYDGSGQDEKGIFREQGPYWIIDPGPGAGHDGGRVVCEGTPAELVGHPTSLTGRHLAMRTSGG